MKNLNLPEVEIEKDGYGNVTSMKRKILLQTPTESVLKKGDFVLFKGDFSREYIFCVYEIHNSGEVRIKGVEVGNKNITDLYIDNLCNLKLLTPEQLKNANIII